MAKAYHAKELGRHGGTATANEWTIRELNTLETENKEFVLDDNTLTVPKGTWLIAANAPAYDVGSHVIALYDIDKKRIICEGTTEHTSKSCKHSRSHIMHYLKNDEPIKVQIHHMVSHTSALTGFGVAGNVGNREIYTTINILPAGVVTDT